MKIFCILYFDIDLIYSDLKKIVVHIPEKDTDIEAVHDQDPEEAEAIPEAGIYIFSLFANIK